MALSRYTEMWDQIEVEGQLFFLLCSLSLPASILPHCSQAVSCCCPQVSFLPTTGGIAPNQPGRLCPTAPGTQECSPGQQPWGMNPPGAVPTELTQTDDAMQDVPVLSQ